VPKYQILYWHDIPVQIRVREGRNRISRALPQRFQSAVDKAAMRAGHASGDAYTDGYHWSELQEHPGEAEAILDALVAELEARYPEIDWRQTAARLKEKS